MSNYKHDFDAAQAVTLDQINGQVYERVRNDDDGDCRSCGVPAGMLHLFGCSIERCPKCNGQSISCGCLGGARW